MSRNGGEYVRLITVRAPDIMDGPHTFEWQEDSYLYTCRHCGEERETCGRCERLYSPYGDGWDGECPSCADLGTVNAG